MMHGCSGPHCWSANKGKTNKCLLATTNFGYIVYNVLINFGYTGRNFGYFWVFRVIFFGYTGIPLPPLADPDCYFVQL